MFVYLDLEPAVYLLATDVNAIDKARYFDVVVGERRIANAAWAYPSPTRAFETIRDHLAFYPHLMDACLVGEEQMQAQSGGFYGGWITSNIVGPFKGEPGTQGWQRHVSELLNISKSAALTMSSRDQTNDVGRARPPSTHQSFVRS